MMRALALLVLVACGSADSLDQDDAGAIDALAPDTAFEDSEPPELVVIFPPSSSLTNGRAVTVRGSSSDQSTVVEILVNGEPADSHDSYKTWERRVSLELGDNEISVEAIDALGNRSTSTTISIRSKPRIDFVSTVVFEPVSQQLLIGASSGEIFKFDPATGQRSLFSNNRSSETLAGAIQSIAVDEATGRIFASDPIARSIVSVDPVSGTRRLVSNNFSPTSAVLFENPRDLLFDSAANRLLVLDDSRLISVDIATGARTIVSDDSSPGVPAFSLRLLAHGPDETSVVVVASTQLIAIELETGARSVVSADMGLQTRISSSSSMTVDRSQGRAFVLARQPGRDNSKVVAIDLQTGARTVSVSGLASTTHGLPLSQSAVSAVVDDQLWLSSRDHDVIFRASLTTGEHVVVDDNRFPSADHPFGVVRGLHVLDGERMLVSDTLNQQGGLSTVNTNTGQRLPIAGRGVDGSSFPTQPFDYAPSTQQLFSSAGLLYDLNTGSSSELDTDGITSKALEADLDRNRLILIEGDDVVVVEDGQRTLFSPRRPDHRSERAVDLVFHKDHPLFLMTTFGVFSLDLVSGVRTPVLDSARGDDLIEPGTTLDLSRDRRELYVVESNNRAVVSLDLATKELTRLSNAVRPNRDNFMVGPAQIAVDGVGRLIVYDQGRHAMLSVDPKTGERVILSQGVDSR